MVNQAAISYRWSSRWPLRPRISRGTLKSRYIAGAGTETRAAAAKNPLYGLIVLIEQSRES